MFSEENLTSTFHRQTYYHYGALSHLFPGARNRSSGIVIFIESATKW